MSGADLTAEFREGASAAADGEPARCPYYATSPAADAWHAGHAWERVGRPAFAGSIYAGDVLQVTKGRGELVNLWADGRRQIVARVRWNAPTLSDAPPVQFEAGRAWNSSKAERDAKLLELGAAAPLRSKGRPVEDAGHLPLFVAGNEPSLF